jgi:heme exporter protein C
LLKAENTEVLDRKNIKATFAIPGVLPNNETLSSGTLIVADEAEGYMVMPAAFALYSDTLAIAQGGTWSHKMDQMTTDWTFSFPFRGILYETIRNTFFHVAIWFAMFILLIIGLIYSIKYLRSSHLDDDAVASSFTHVAVFFGLIGIATGSVWAKNTWGAYWTNDPKLNMSAVALMIYLAYSILRSSISGDDRRARVAAAYNIFAFVAMIPLIFIIPRLTSSLHPGNGGNPALGGEDLDNTLRMVFYPAIIGLTLLGAWISSVLYRIKRIQLALIERSLNN